MGWEFLGYRRSAPRAVKDGIRARSQRGKIGSTWWSERWLKVLESYGRDWESNRLERGRRYARRGQVMNFQLGKGRINAKVQGSMPKPYMVTISVKTLDESQWKKAVKTMSREAAYAAKLLSGNMPENIEKAFGSSAKLFPSEAQFDADCTCPDIANPCKHIAAVCYIIAEEFDRDPFMIFELRGRKRDELLAELRRARSTVTRSDTISSHSEKAKATYEKDEGSKGVKELVDSFWHTARKYQLDINLEPPHVKAALIKRLGEPNFWRLPINFVEAMENVYAQVSRRALMEAYDPAKVDKENESDSLQRT